MVLKICKGYLKWNVKQYYGTWQDAISAALFFSWYQKSCKERYLHSTFTGLLPCLLKRNWCKLISSPLLRQEINIQRQRWEFKQPLLYMSIVTPSGVTCRRNFSKESKESAHSQASGDFVQFPTVFEWTSEKLLEILSLETFFPLLLVWKVSISC